MCHICCYVNLLSRFVLYRCEIISSIAAVFQNAESQFMRDLTGESYGSLKTRCFLIICDVIVRIRNTRTVACASNLISVRATNFCAFLTVTVKRVTRVRLTYSHEVVMPLIHVL